ncbi:hypothetical protein [Rickettsia oklahomensis]|uniref:Uncharacterized protein n=1 Tax=Rickettsia oklahomensis TaxID=3141789 RepID=A0AAU7C0Z3_9RICK
MNIRFFLSHRFKVCSRHGPPTSAKNYRLNDDLNLSSHEWFMKAKEYKDSWWNCWLVKIMIIS